MPASDDSPNPKTPPSTGSLLESARTYFKGDRFATDQCEAQIDEASPGHAVCSFTIEPHHRNAMGNVMGGAIFTLADFACAVASGVNQPPNVTVSSSIEFISGARGSRLIATCDVDRSGRRMGFYTTRVEDEAKTLVALVTSTCMRI